MEGGCATSLPARVGDAREGAPSARAFFAHAFPERRLRPLFSRGWLRRRCGVGGVCLGECRGRLAASVNADEHYEQPGRAAEAEDMRVHGRCRIGGIVRSQRLSTARRECIGSVRRSVLVLCWCCACVQCVPSEAQRVQRCRLERCGCWIASYSASISPSTPSLPCTHHTHLAPIGSAPAGCRCASPPRIFSYHLTRSMCRTEYMGSCFSMGRLV